jgi:hypothetical protein
MVWFCPFTNYLISFYLVSIEKLEQEYSDLSGLNYQDTFVFMLPDWRHLLTIKFKTDAKNTYNEDEAAIRRVLAKILSEENDSYQVEDAEDGILGFEK